MKTVIVEIYAGPGTGKSTTMAGAFSQLKTEGINAEQVPEFAKDLVYEERNHALGFQPYVIAKQMWRIQRLIGKVPVVLTDSPIMLGLVYGEKHGSGYHSYIREAYREWDNINIRLIRDNDHHPYISDGRTQKKVEEAEEIDNRIERMLRMNGVKYTEVSISDNPQSAIVELVHQHLEQNAEEEREEGATYSLRGH